MVSVIKESARFWRDKYIIKKLAVAMFSPFKVKSIFPKGKIIRLGENYSRPSDKQISSIFENKKIFFHPKNAESQPNGTGLSVAKWQE